jgi:hypothetical protein
MAAPIAATTSPCLSAGRRTRASPPPRRLLPKKGVPTKRHRNFFKSKSVNDVTGLKCQRCSRPDSRRDGHSTPCAQRPRNRCRQSRSAPRRAGASVSWNVTSRSDVVLLSHSNSVDDGRATATLRPHRDSVSRRPRPTQNRARFSRRPDRRRIYTTTPMDRGSKTLRVWTYVCGWRSPFRWSGCRS